LIEQLLEERAVVNERLALLLRADVPVLLRHVNGVGGSVVLNNRRVIDGDAGCPLIEVVDRVASRACA
jgi:hypothetical protein